MQFQQRIADTATRAQIICIEVKAAGVRHLNHGAVQRVDRLSLFVGSDRRFLVVAVVSVLGDTSS